MATSEQKERIREAHRLLEEQIPELREVPKKNL